MSAEEERAIVGSQTVDRALSLLGCFSADQPSIFLHEFSRLTGLTNPPTHRLLKALESDADVHVERLREVGGGVLGGTFSRVP